MGVQQCFVNFLTKPRVLANYRGFSFFAPLLQKGHQHGNKNRFNLSSVFQLWTLLCVCNITYACMCYVCSVVCMCAGLSMSGC